jgi:diketogulonate reductase-like aldo/keto reductase
MGFNVVAVLRQIADRYGVSPARVALAWTMSRPSISSVLIGARRLDHLEDNIKAVDLDLTGEDMRALDEISDPGIPYPRWMVLQLDQAEDPRPKVLAPERFTDGGPWQDLRAGPSEKV